MDEEKGVLHVQRVSERVCMCAWVQHHGSGVLSRPRGVAWWVVYVGVEYRTTRLSSLTGQAGGLQWQAMKEVADKSWQGRLRGLAANTCTRCLANPPPLPPNL